MIHNHISIYVFFNILVQFIEIDEERNSLTKVNEEFVVNHILSSDGTFEETEACTSMPNHKSNMLHLSCITTSKYHEHLNIRFDEKDS